MSCVERRLRCADSAVIRDSAAHQAPQWLTRKEGSSMCLGIPGKVRETYREHDVLMGKVDFGGVQSKSASSTSPRPAGRLRAGPRRLRAARASTKTRRARLRDARGMDELDELEASAMKYLDEYRDAEAARKLADGHRPDRDPAVDAHGSLRRADAHHREVRHRRTAAGGESSWCTGPAARCASPRSR